MTNLIPWTRGRRSPALRGVRPFSWDLGEFDRLVNDMWSGFGLEQAQDAFSPRVDIHEDEAEYRITAELPGVEEKDFEVSLEGDVLTLRGEKRDQREERREGYRHMETVSGSFERRFRLPTEVDPGKVRAQHKNGVLTITVPKAETAKPRTIPVQTS